MLSSSSALSSALDGTRALNLLKTVFGSTLELCHRRLLPGSSLFTKSVTARRRSSCNGRFWDILKESEIIHTKVHIKIYAYIIYYVCTS